MEIAGAPVSRETFERLTAFESLVRKWNPRINLVSKSSLEELWDRHIVDSAQLFQLAPGFSHWADFGSGGGFPGVIVAILSRENAIPQRFTLIESDQRKCAFLRTAARELQLEIEVLNQRIEEVAPLSADVLSARALADLSKLLDFADRHLSTLGTCLFPKGSTWEKEHKDARKIWSYSCEVIKSTTNPEAAILKIQDLQRE